MLVPRAFSGCFADIGLTEISALQPIHPSPGTRYGAVARAAMAWKGSDLGCELQALSCHKEETEANMQVRIVDPKVVELRHL